MATEVDPGTEVEVGPDPGPDLAIADDPGPGPEIDAGRRRSRGASVAPAAAPVHQPAPPLALPPDLDLGR